MTSFFRLFETGSAQFRKVKKHFINERILSYWNKLPTDLKNS